MVRKFLLNNEAVIKPSSFPTPCSLTLSPASPPTSTQFNLFCHFPSSKNCFLNAVIIVITYDVFMFCRSFRYDFHFTLYEQGNFYEALIQVNGPITRVKDSFFVYCWAHWNVRKFFQTSISLFDDAISGNGRNIFFSASSIKLASLL